MNDTQTNALKDFARECIRTAWDGGLLDGSDIQELALKFGLIEPGIATAEDAEVDFNLCEGDEMTRFVPWLKD